MGDGQKYGLEEVSVNYIREERKEVSVDFKDFS